MDTVLFKTTKIKKQKRNKVFKLFEIRPRMLNLYIRTASDQKTNMTVHINKRRDLIMDLLEIFCVDHLYLEMKLNLETISSVSEEEMLKDLLLMLKKENLIKDQAMELFENIYPKIDMKPLNIKNLKNDERLAYFFFESIQFYYR